MNVDAYKQEVICRTREDAVAFQEFVRALPAAAPRVRIKAGLYPDNSATGRFKVVVTVNRMGLMDGADAIKAVRDRTKALRTGTVCRGERELALIG